MLSLRYIHFLHAAIFLILFIAGNVAGDSRNQENSGQINSIDVRLQPDSFKHIILTWQDDPRYSQAVTWRTDNPLKQAVAEVAISDPSPDFGDAAQKYPAATSSLNTGAGRSYYHSVNFSNLRPNVVYAYRVGNGKVWSEWFQFRTAAEKTNDFSFIYLGDAQHKIYTHWSRTIRAAVLEAPKARFMIHTGDMVDRPNSDHQWGEWFKAGGWSLSMIPSIPVPGNHEYGKQGLEPVTLSKYWKPQFALPRQDREDLDETVYYIDFQGARVIALNSNLAIQDQAQWMAVLLENNPNRWTIIAAHHPIYSSAKGRKNKRLDKYWKPVFEKYKVDLVLQGHDHVYARGRGSCPGGKECQGPIYITSVSGPGMYKLDGRKWMDRSAENMQLFQVISVSENNLKYQSITVTGEVFDEFELTK